MREKTKEMLKGFINYIEEEKRNGASVATVAGWEYDLYYAQQVLEDMGYDCHVFEDSCMYLLDVRL